MASNQDLTITVALRNEVAKPIGELQKQIEKLGGSIDKLGDANKKAATSTGQLTMGIVAGNIALRAMRNTLNLVRSEFGKSLEASNQYTRAMLGLSSIAAAFGADQDKATEAAKSLASDGLLSVTEAASGLKNLLASEFRFSLEQSVELMNGLRDSAAFNRQGTLEYGNAIVGATTGLKNLNSIMVDNAGLTTNLSVITRRLGIELRDIGNATTDAGKQQEIFNAIMQELAPFAGDAARMTNTLEGAQAALEVTAFNLHTTMGQILTPAVTALTKEMAILTGEMDRGLKPVAEETAIMLLKVATNIRILNAALITIFPSAQTAAGVLDGFKRKILEVGKEAEGVTGIMFRLADSLNLLQVKNVASPLEKARDRIKEISIDYAASVKKIREEGLGSFRNIEKEAVERFGAAADAAEKAAKKIREAIERENRRFSDSMDSMNRRFKESLRDMVVAHRERVDSIGKQLDEEKRDFAETMKDRTEDFNKTMGDMEKRHKKKVDSIKEQMEDERKKISMEIDEIVDKNREGIEQFKLGMKERLANLTGQLDKEKAKGQFANKNRIASLEDMLVREEKSLKAQLITKESLIENEIQRAKDAHQERFDDLQEELEDEVLEHKDATVEKSAEFEKETAKIRDEHVERLSALQIELDLELEIQKKHSKDFEKFKDAQRESDIARLKRRFDEDRNLAEQNHQRSLQDIAKRSEEARKTEEKARVETDKRRSEDIKRESSQSTSRSQAASLRLASTASTGFSSGNIFASSGLSPAFFGSLLGLADGGIVNKPTLSMIGEEGPEVVLPLNRPDRARELLQKSGVGAGNTFNINMPVTVVSSEIDMDELVERMAFAITKQGTI